MHSTGPPGLASGSSNALGVACPQGVAGCSMTRALVAPGAAGLPPGCRRRPVESARACCMRGCTERALWAFGRWPRSRQQQQRPPTLQLPHIEGVTAVALYHFVPSTAAHKHQAMSVVALHGLLRAVQGWADGERAGRAAEGRSGFGARESVGCKFCGTCAALPAVCPAWLCVHAAPRGRLAVAGAVEVLAAAARPTAQKLGRRGGADISRGWQEFLCSDMPCSGVRQHRPKRQIPYGSRIFPQLPKARADMQPP
jgi:hypothetical protein